MLLDFIENKTQSNRNRTKVVTTQEIKLILFSKYKRFIVVLYIYC